MFFTFLLSGFSSAYIHKTKKSTSPQTCPEMSIMMMMMLSRSSYKKKQYSTYIRVHRCSSTSAYPSKLYSTRRDVRRYIHTYTRYPVSLAARYRGCVPISPVDTTWRDGGTQVRTQLPLRLCWAIAMHKSQGQTLDKAVIELSLIHI